jgi:hypothetical protein
MIIDEYLRDQFKSAVLQVLFKEMIRNKLS